MIVKVAEAGVATARHTSSLARLSLLILLLARYVRYATVLGRNTARRRHSLIFVEVECLIAALISELFGVDILLVDRQYLLYHVGLCECCSLRRQRDTAGGTTRRDHALLVLELGVYRELLAARSDIHASSASISPNTVSARKEHSLIEWRLRLIYVHVALRSCSGPVLLSCIALLCSICLEISRGHEAG